jgi:hypothetical protein
MLITDIKRKLVFMTAMTKQRLVPTELAGTLAAFGEDLVVGGGVRHGECKFAAILALVFGY